MTELHSSTLSAFCDGEVVDPQVLREALDDPQSRSLLWDFARLRAVSVSSAALPPSLARLPLSSKERPGPQLRVAFVAAMVLLAALTGALLSSVWTPRRSEPPTPARVVRFVPGVDWHAVPR